MTSLFFTYQTNDTVDQPRENMADSLQLDLIKVHDESNLLIPENISQSRPSIVRPAPQAPVAKLDDTLDPTLKITNIPVRKAAKNGTTVKHIESKTLFSPTPIHHNDTLWPSILLVLSILLVGFTKAFSSNRLNQITKSIFSIQAAQEVVREEKVFFHRANFSLFAVFIIVLSLFLESLITRNYVQTGFTMNRVQIAGIILGIYSIKFISLTVFSTIFSSTQLIGIYIYNTLIYNYLAAALLLPSMALIYFSPFNTTLLINYIIIPGLIIIFTYRILRLFLIGRENNFLNFYIILYICTLEILPLVVLGKIFIFK